MAALRWVSWSPHKETHAQRGKVIFPASRGGGGGPGAVIGVGPDPGTCHYKEKVVEGKLTEERGMEDMELVEGKGGSENRIRRVEDWLWSASPAFFSINQDSKERVFCFEYHLCIRVEVPL